MPPARTEAYFGRFEFFTLYSPLGPEHAKSWAGLVGTYFFASSGLLTSNGRAARKFRKRRLPKNVKTCSALGLQFNALPGFDLSQIVAAGQDGGLFGAGAAVGHNCTFDFQRETSILTGTTTFYSGYTPVSNMAVGAYLHGAGYSEAQVNVIAGTFAATMSSNAGDPEQSLYWDFGFDLAAGGVTPSCTP